ncbi:pentapeptide repeat-containing protein [Nonomuraea maritima]|uniref:pentapeptide repeat-containing protein n=1 Tax=Nonomuraea maritima TaxID=683260 RepID=UPI00371701D0
MLLAVLVIGGLTLLGVRGLKPEAQLSAATLFDLLKIAFAVVAGLGGLVALVVAYRRQKVAEAAQRVSERSEERAHWAEQREATKLHNDRFATAAGQLGHDSPAVRLAGVHALAGLADDAPTRELRQTCIDVLCAYLRMPYAPDPGRDAAEDDRLTFAGLREVRHTIIRLITVHLRENAPVSWQGHDFDFTGTVFDGGDFTSAVFSSGEVSFRNATFCGREVMFWGAKFSGARVLFHEATFSYGEVYFADAAFAGGRVSFNRAKFSGGVVSFDAAVFSDGEVSFPAVTFSGGIVGFEAATFSGGQVSFAPDTQFSGGRVSFDHAMFSDGRIFFTRANFSDGQVSFRHAKFTGGRCTFKDSTFSGGEVSFDKATFSGGRVDLSDVRLSMAAPVGLPVPRPPGLLLPHGDAAAIAAVPSSRDQEAGEGLVEDREERSE